MLTERYKDEETKSKSRGTNVSWTLKSEYCYICKVQVKPGDYDKHVKEDLVHLSKVASNPTYDEIDEEIWALTQPRVNDEQDLPVFVQHESDEARSSDYEFSEGDEWHDVIIPKREET